MLKVTIEILPWGDSTMARKLEEIQIINDGSGNEEIGNYVIRHLTRQSESLTNFFVHDYRRSEGPLKLTRMVLQLLEEDKWPKSDGQSEAQITHSMKP